MGLSRVVRHREAADEKREIKLRKRFCVVAMGGENGRRSISGNSRHTGEIPEAETAVKDRHFIQPKIVLRQKEEARTGSAKTDTLSLLAINGGVSRTKR